MNKRVGFSIIAFGCASLLFALIAQAHPTKALFGRAAAGDHTLTLGSGSAPASITSSYQNSVVGNVTTSNGNTVELSFSNAKSLGGGFVELAPHGHIYNFGSSNNQLTGVNGVSFTGSGSFTFKPAVTKGILADVSPISVSAGGSKIAVPSCDFFEIEAGDNGASITSISFSYSCDANGYDVKLANGTYTGIGSDSYTYKLTLNNGSATFVSLDKASQTSLSGSVSMSSKTAVSLSLTNCSVNLTYDGHTLTYVSKSGSNSSKWTLTTLNRVYTVENFESYSASGQGYTSSTTKYQTTGLRSQFYADYYTGSDSGEIGGSGWPVMTSSDNTTYNGSKGHNSSKTGIFKFSNNMSMRYISMKELYGINSVIGKGSTLSVWVRGAYTNTNFNANHSSNTPMKMYAYYDSPLTPSNQTTKRETFEFTVTAGSTWQHFEFSLTSGREYYGFGFYAKQSSGSTQYVPIDDIEIYTASPYAEYIPPVSVTGVSVSPTSLSLITGNSSQLTATVSPSNATNQAVTWSSSNTSKATVDQDGTVHAIAAGSATITVTTADGGFTANCSVTISDPVTYYPEGTYAANITISSATYKLVIAFGNESNGLIAVRVSNSDASPTGVTYNSGNNTFTIPCGSITISSNSISVGNITGTYDYANDRLTNVNTSGALKSYVSNVTLTHPTDSSTSKFVDCDGTTSELQSLFKRRYMSGSWQVDDSNADRITSNTTQYVSGTGSVKRRGYSGGAVALNFNADFSSAITVKNVHYWVYNPSASDITLRMWGYKSTNLPSNNNFETGSVTAKANQWTYVAMGFTSASIYNFQIADFNNTGVYLSFDNIYFH